MIIDLVKTMDALHERGFKGTLETSIKNSYNFLGASHGMKELHQNKNNSNNNNINNNIYALYNILYYKIKII